jgi:hypothetical protein
MKTGMALSLIGTRLRSDFGITIGGAANEKHNKREMPIRILMKRT